jgi:hypothetical protein
MVVASVAQNLARQLLPVLRSRLAVRVNLDELPALGWSLAAFVAAALHRRGRVARALVERSLCPVPVIARLAEDPAAHWLPVLPPGGAFPVDFVEAAALVGFLATIIAAVPAGLRQSLALVLSPRQGAPLEVLDVASIANDLAVQGLPVLSPCLARTINLDELAALGWPLALFVRAVAIRLDGRHVGQDGHCFKPRPSTHSPSLSFPSLQDLRLQRVRIQA